MFNASPTEKEMLAQQSGLGYSSVNGPFGLHSLDPFNRVGFLNPHQISQTGNPDPPDMWILFDL